MKQKKTGLWSSFSLYFRITKSFVGKRIYILMFLNILSVVIESIGLLLFIPFLQTIKITGEKPGAVSGYIDSIFQVLGIPVTVSSTLFLLVAVFLLKGLCVFFMTSYRQYLSTELRFDLREKLIQGFSNLDYSYAITRKTGFFSNLVVGETDGAIHAINAYSYCLTSLMTTIIFVSVAVFVHPQLSGIIVIAGVVNVILLRVISKIAQSCSKEASRLNARLNGLLVELVHSMKYLKSTAQFHRVKKLIRETNLQSSATQMRHSYADAAYNAIREPLMVICIASIIYFYVVLQGQSLGVVMVPILFFYRCMLEASFLQGYWRTVCDYSAGLENLHVHFQDFEHHQESFPHQPVLLQSIGDVEFRKVQFSYGKKKVFENLNLQIEKQSSIALVGSSGVGKTTMIDLLTGLLKPQSGMICVNGTPLSDLDIKSYRKKIGYVVQDTVIFSDTIAHNICMELGMDLDEVTLCRVKSAAELSCVDSFVSHMPNGYMTKIGERGVGLSGGQKQRLAIARELYRNTELLILDESTSALDSESEYLMKQSLHNLKGKVTVILISHRLSSVRHADKIFVIEDGDIVEEGDFQSLVQQRGGKFRKMFELQQVI